VDTLGNLKAVAKEPQILAQRDRIPLGQSGEQRAGRRGQHTLAGAGFDLLGQGLAAHGENQHRDPGSAVGRCAGVEFALDARLAAAGNHRSGEAGQGFGGDARPPGILRRDDEARTAHGKGFGEGRVDRDTIDVHGWVTVD